MRPALFLIIVVLRLGSISAVAAQVAHETDHQARLWVSAGLGGGTGGIAAMAGVDVLVQHHLFSIRAADVSDPLGGDELWDVAALYGRAIRWRRGLLGVSTGLARLSGMHPCSELTGCTRVAPRISLPLAVQGAWHPLSFLGFSIYGFANFNSAKSLGGVVVAIHLGRLW